MGEFLTSIGGIFTQTITWVGNVLTMIVAQPILLIFIGLGIVSAVIGITMRLIRR